MTPEAEENWCSARDTVAMLEPKYGASAKQIITDRAKRGFLDTRAEKMIITHFQVTELRNTGDYGWVELPKEDSSLTLYEIHSHFWLSSHASATDVLFDDLYGFGRSVSANWEIGDFSFKQEFSGDILSWSLFEAVGVMFKKRQILHLVGPSLKSLTNSKGRSTTFDWEGAFADVAARLYHDLQFPDVHALGVQAEIVKVLRESFEKNRLPAPEDTSLKNKARRIVAALRAK